MTGVQAGVVPARLAPMDAAFQRGFHGIDMRSQACSGADRGKHRLTPAPPHRRRGFARQVGLEQTTDYNYHRVLNRNRWSGRWVARAVCFRCWSTILVPDRASRHRPLKRASLSDDGEPGSRRRGTFIETRFALRTVISSRRTRPAMALGHASARDPLEPGASGHCHS